MSIFKTTQEILKLPWRDQDLSQVINRRKPENWHQLRELTIDDVVLWEEIYYQPGNVGIYAAWSPYADYYIITYDLFLNTPYSMETFYGTNAVNEVYYKSKELGIDLPIKKIWINEVI